MRGDSQSSPPGGEREEVRRQRAPRYEVQIDLEVLLRAGGGGDRVGAADERRALAARRLRRAAGDARRDGRQTDDGVLAGGEAAALPAARHEAHDGEAGRDVDAVREHGVRGGGPGRRRGPAGRFIGRGLSARLELV
jgi:D-serine deaminase-like pyridoxal phosphate-dependent protein